MSEVQARSGWIISLRIAVLMILLSGCLGYFVAFFEDRSPSQTQWLVTAAFALFTIGLVFQIIRDGRQIWADMAAMPSRERAASRMMALILAAGGAAGASMTLFGGTASNPFPTIGSMSAVAAIGWAAAILLLAPWATWRWWNMTDEHERQAYVEGGYIAASATVYLGCGWWLLSRARLLPPPDGMAIILGMSFIWSAIWLYRKYS